MKKNAITRIVLYSILVLVLLGLLIGGLTMHGIFGITRLGGSDVPDSASPTESSAGEVPADAVSKLNIDWAAGDITIVPADTDRISFSETSDGKYTMYWYVDGDTLSIDYAHKSVFFGFRPGKLRKDLTVTVPRDWAPREIELDAASTNLSISDLRFGELEVDGADNRMTLTDCTAGSVSLDGASNHLTFTGSLGSLETDGVSTTCVLALRTQPDAIDMDGVSARLEMTLPADSGFTVDADGLSFDLDTDFEGTGDRKHFRAGDGSCRITVDGVSTSLEIRKAD